MKNKLYFSIFLLILVAQFTFADIDLTTDLKEKYNLGDPIKSSFDVALDRDFNGLFKLTLYCDEFDIDYFVTLIDIKQNEKITIMPPGIKPAAWMKDNCRLKASLESLDKEILDSFDSAQFEITDELEIQLTVDKESALPGETIDINGRIDASFDSSDALDALSVIVSFDGEQEELSVEDGEFSKELKLGNKIKSGKHLLLIEATDSFGNNADKVANVEVKAKISKIVVELNKRSFKPEETVEIKPILYDQAGAAVLDEDASIKISKGSNEIFSKDVKSYEKAAYTFLRYAEPGDYIVELIHDNLRTEETIAVETLKKLDIKLEGEIVNIKNIGNVIYNDVVNLNLFGKEKTYVLNKKIKLDPDESLTVDLSKEVPTDNYAVEAVVNDEKISLAGDILIKDKRSLVNKITGAAIAVGKGLLVNRPILASIIMILVIASIILFFVRKRKKDKDI